MAVEEYVEGHEGFYDTITINGQVVHEFVTHYPNVLEAMRARWISPQFVTTNRLDDDGYNELKQMGQAVVQALGIGTSATHMEWFFGPKGLRFSEIGCRPPGVRAWDLCGRQRPRHLPGVGDGRRPRPSVTAAVAALLGGHDRAATRSRWGDRGLRRCGRAAGAVRGLGDRRPSPPPGTATQPVEAGYMANAWVRMRHPDYDTLREMLDDVGQTLHVRAS